MTCVERSANTSEYVAVHAAMEPARPAVVVGEETLGYGLVYEHIKNFTVGLHALGIAEGDRCIVKIAHPYVHWLILLALENLAAVSCSMQPQEGNSDPRLLGCANKLISQHTEETGGLVQSVCLPLEWVQTQLNTSTDDACYREVLRFLAPHAGQRIKRTSGTTGGMKIMLSSNQGEEAIIKSFAEVMGFTRDTRYLLVNSFVISSVYLAATLCLRLGALVIFERGESRLELIARHRVTHVRFFQQQLLDILKDIEQNTLPKPAKLTVILGAAPVSRALWDRVQGMLATTIVYAYNANECGSICIMGPDGVGAVRAGVQVSIVGPDDQVLAPGQTGRVRVKVPHMVTSYIDNPLADRQNFKHGWFYTGDAGQMIGPRLLKLLGRVDDVLIFAGFKRTADDYEVNVCVVEAVREACALAAQDALGVDRLVLCLVATPGSDQSALVQTIARLFPAFITEGGRVFFVDSLPRTANGKLQRAAMKARLPQLTGAYML